MQTLPNGETLSIGIGPTSTSAKCQGRRLAIVPQLALRGKAYHNSGLHPGT